MYDTLGSLKSASKLCPEFDEARHSTVLARKKKTKHLNAAVRKEKRSGAAGKTARQKYKKTNKFIYLPAHQQLPMTKLILHAIVTILVRHYYDIIIDGDTCGSVVCQSRTHADPSPMLMGD